MEKINNSEDIHIKVDQNNLIYIDPNSVIDSDGNIKPRNLQAENLVMYVNLEADVVPRSVLASTNEKNTLTSLASGTLNFLRNNNGGDYDTTWTDSYLSSKEKKDSNGIPTGDFFASDNSGQSFGIESITIQIKGFNAIPNINIKFVDVRGKTLFESPENSPYKTFFHIPWPIFYLTVKGFYGKAIKYRLHLVKFTSKFNESNGNFEVDTTFVGSTYAWLSDIPLQGILNAPYLYPNESEQPGISNTSTGQKNQTITKSSRGYEMLKTVYEEYKAKGLIDKDFPTKTLREVITISNTLDKLLEKQIFDQIVDMRLFVGLKEFEETLNDFETAIVAWGNENLDKTAPATSLTITNSTGNKYFYYLKSDKQDKDYITPIVNQGTLARLLDMYMGTRGGNNDGKLIINKAFTENLLNKTTSTFDKQTMLIGRMKNVMEYVKDDSNLKRAVNIEGVVDDIRKIRKDFYEQRTIFETDIETEMNKIVLDKNKGFGFSPTIRNLFAIILANAEVLIRLMKDVHKKAFDQSEERKLIVGKYSKESVGESIYPWPEIKATVLGKDNTIIYPGDPDFHLKLGSESPVRWPEVAFLETYIGVSTNKVDPLANKEGGVNKIPTITQNNKDIRDVKKISTANTVTNILPYINKEPASFIYEIWERALSYTLIDSYNNDTIKELANIEFQNIKNAIKGDNTLIKILKDKILYGRDVNGNVFNTIEDELEKIAPHENFIYYKDQLPTTDYIKSFYDQPYSIEQYSANNNSNDTTTYTKLVNNVLNYTPQSYRTNVYPFSSNLYYTYSKVIYDQNILSNKKFLEVNTTQGLISGQIDPIFWVKKDLLNLNKTNLFSTPIKVNGNTTLMLNTPYFHKMLYNDFFNENTKGKYVGSAYLLLNSLPFVDLNDVVKDYVLKDGSKVDVLVSTLFKEVGSSQYIPYHLMLKWGSIYHRYKKFLIDKVDILSPIFTGATDTITSPIDGESTFDDEDHLIFTTNEDLTISDFLSYNSQPFTKDTFHKDVEGKINVGVHPYYDALFHQVVNDYTHFEYTDPVTTFLDRITSKTMTLTKKVLGNSGKIKYWTQFVDNSRYTDSSEDLRYTLLPSVGGNLYAGYKLDNGIKTISNLSFDVENQNGYRIIWEDEYIGNEYNGIKFNTAKEHLQNVTYDSVSTLMDGNYKKVLDLIATFTPDVLDEFENHFINFASERLNLSVSDRPFDNVVYYKFQDLLKEIVSVPQDKNDSSDIDVKIKDIKLRQVIKLKKITSDILTNENLIKITLGNPKEIDPHVFHGFSKMGTNSFTYESGYLESEFNQDNMDFYLGEEPESGCYKNFFIVNDVKFTKTNLLTFRPLIHIYAGWVSLKQFEDENFVPTQSSFRLYLRTNVYNNGASDRFTLFMNTLVSNFKTLNLQIEPSRITFFDGYNNRALKVELYNFFKSMNDKWIAGNSIGQRSLLEEFLFLDKANKDIGDDYFFDISRLTSMGDPNNSKTSLFSAISILLQDTGFDIRALPAYINFYGTNFSNTPKLTPSKTIAKNLFGTFLEVDTHDSSPKIIIQYVGKNSTRPDMKDNGKYKFTDDSYNIGNPNNNPVMITLPKVFKTGDLAKTNKVVAFEVSFGDQNQGIFKGITLDQATIKNTSESFYVLENLARSESGASSYNVDIGLYEYYRQAAYSCEITCIGNVMIQPTMFFYLKNIPMFKGTYWITEVSHSIKNNNITTTFKGSRMPYTALPDLKDSFMSSYRTLFDKLAQKAQTRVEQSSLTKTTITLIAKDGNTYFYDTGSKHIKNEEVTNDANIQTGIPYNGFNDSTYIQKVINSRFINAKSKPPNSWLRAIAVTMDGPKYAVSDTTSMGVIAKTTTIPIKKSPLKWIDVKTHSVNSYYYAAKFDLDNVNADDVVKYVTTFVNPENSKKIVVNPSYSLNQDNIKVQGPLDLFSPTNEYGIALSPKLMRDLNLQDGDVVYFNLV
jgi:hypothetical protein